MRLHPYEILATDHNCGVIEFVKDGLSVDYIRKAMARKYGRSCDLFDYFVKNFGRVSSLPFKKAQKNFADSLAAYSLASYVL